jgi:hypothetical protein
MSQLAASDGQPRCSGGGAGFFLCRLETVRFQAEGWQEPYESRGSRTDLRGTGGETPPVYPTLKFGTRCDIFNISQFGVTQGVWHFK